VQGAPVDEHSVVGCPPGTRLLRIERLEHAWRVWLSTRDYVWGTYLLMHDSGQVQRVTARVDEGDEVYVVRPTDDVVRMIRDAGAGDAQEPSN